MVVQQDFEKGRSQRLWFRRYDRYKTSHFFQGLTLGAEGGGACTWYFTVHVIFGNFGLRRPPKFQR